MTKMDFETIAEYLDDRYTTAEFVDMFDIPMTDLVDCLWDYLQEHKQEELLELLAEKREGDTQLEFEF